MQDLISLFDDCDTTVKSCVDRALMDMGRDVTSLLKEAADAEKGENRRRMILEKRKGINTLFRMKELESLSRHSATAGFSLYETAFVISSMIDEDLSRDDFQAMIMECCARVVAETSPLRTAIENVEIFNHIFFNVLGFRITDSSCTDLKYALLPRVLSSRIGNPFTVSLIWFIIAAEASLSILPLCLKGGFIPAYVENGKELFYINLNRGGTLLKGRVREQFAAESSIEPRLHSTAVLPGIWLESLVKAGRGNPSLERTLAGALDKWTDERYLDNPPEEEEEDA